MNMHFSVIMPTFNQCAFIRRAILSLMNQTHGGWELVIINDGCTDETEDFISDYLKDPRVTYIKNKTNMGLGYALNQGIDAAKYDYIAYLPSDDYYYENHLETIKEKFESSRNNILVYAGLKFFSNDSLQGNNVTESVGIKHGMCLQLVQTAHKKVNCRWLERKQYLTDDLFQMYWAKLLGLGDFARTNQITCYWTSHPFQRHKIIGERHGGGLNRARSFYGIKEPIRIKVSREKFTDEEALFAQFRNNPSSHRTNPLKILIVGELAYNAERISALEKAGHVLYGLWCPNPRYSFSTVGPLPFGHVTDIPFDDKWVESVREIKPDVIYGLLNAESVPFVYDVVRKLPEIPYVWHFKEGPSICFSTGDWSKLIYLYKHASGRIFLNELLRKWYGQFLPESNTPTLIMDGDLPSKAYFKNDFSPKLSDADGEVHTVVTGRFIGLSRADVEVLVRKKIHIHTYTENYFDVNTMPFGALMNEFPEYFHSHHHVDASEWTKELSQYDAGWLHCCTSQNEGNLMKASWDDLNMPARMATYAAAGIPFILPGNEKHLVASRDYSVDLKVGITFKNYDELGNKLFEECKTRTHGKNMMKQRLKFCFDYYLSDLEGLFQQSIEKF